jgi:hypothetical protein
MFIVDTCFWLHLQDLYAEIKFDIRTIIQKFQWGYSELLKTEYFHFHLDQFIPMDSGYIFPLNTNSLSNYQAKYPAIQELDDADQSIFILGKRDDHIVLTDDSELLMECLGNNIQALRLGPFLLFLAKHGFLSKNPVFKLLKHWETRGTYQKRDLNRWKKDLNLVQ